MIKGEDVRIDPNTVFKHPQLVELGNHVAIDCGFYCTTKLKVGDYVHISPYCTVIGGVNAFFEMCHFSGLAAGCRIMCATDECLGEGIPNPTIPAKYRDKVICKPVKLEMFATLATNVVVVPGVTIREGTLVGANSFVNKDTEPWTVYVGSPAKPLKERRRDVILAYAKELGYLSEPKST